MAYAAIADIQGVIAKWTLDGSTKPTSLQATAIIANVSEEIDTALAARGIDVPVVFPSHFVTGLKMLNVYGAAARILKSMFPDTTGPEETPAYAFWERNYDGGLKAIQTGTMLPSSVTAGVAQPATYFTRNPDAEEDLGDIAEPFFKRSTVF